MKRRLKYTKFGLAENPIGYQVSMLYKGRVLLGDVVGVERNERRGFTSLKIRHFNGEPWPFEPSFTLVEVLGPRP